LLDACCRYTLPAYHVGPESMTAMKRFGAWRTFQFGCIDASDRATFNAA